jgi:hypothetical protein
MVDRFLTVAARIGAPSPKASGKSAALATGNREVTASQARHTHTDALAQEMCALFGRQCEQAADQVALGKIALTFESLQADLSAHGWLVFRRATPSIRNYRFRP